MGFKVQSLVYCLYCFLFKALMGVFFWTNSVALVEDIPLEEKYTSRDELVRDMDAGFQQVGTDSNIYSQF